MGQSIIKGRKPFFVTYYSTHHHTRHITQYCQQ
nr:MAG TPA: hypothetical protein [Caudoviricetes sp.]DAR95071.1 MAG TPA: hypothetical protein [Caudoviricetes sp.]